MELIPKNYFNRFISLYWVDIYQYILQQAFPEQKTRNERIVKARHYCANENNANPENEFIPPLVFKKQDMKQCGVEDVEEAAFYFVCKYGGSIAACSPYLWMNEKERKFGTVYILINCYEVILNPPLLRISLYHELQHAIDIMEKKLELGNEGYENMVNNRPELNYGYLINRILYYGDPWEQNAFLAELPEEISATDMKRNGWQAAYQKTAAYDVEKNLYNCIQEIQSNQKGEVERVMNFVRKNPQHAGIFPPVKNMDVVAYKKVLVQFVTAKLNEYRRRVARTLYDYQQSLIPNRPAV